MSLPSAPRIIAALLAIGGCYWGLLFAPLLLRSDSPAAWLLFGPGYLVTLWYLIRTFTLPTIGIRRTIWISSLLVQGGWLVTMLFDVAQRVAAGRDMNTPSVPAAWWAFATVASIVALLAERDSSAGNATCSPESTRC